MISQKYFKIPDRFFLHSGAVADVKIREKVENTREMREEKKYKKNVG